jgi:molybdopterin-containing oxidoreductase family iron-sulfur binding subunit
MISTPWQTKGSLHKLGTRETLAVTQLHHRMEGFDFVREVSPADAASHKPDRKQPSLYLDPPESTAPTPGAW